MGVDIVDLSPPPSSSPSVGGGSYFFDSIGVIHNYRFCEDRLMPNESIGHPSKCVSPVPISWQYEFPDRSWSSMTTVAFVSVFNLLSHFRRHSFTRNPIGYNLNNLILHTPNTMIAQCFAGIRLRTATALLPLLSLPSARRNLKSMETGISPRS